MGRRVREQVKARTHVPSSPIDERKMGTLAVLEIRHSEEIYKCFLEIATTLRLYNTTE